MRNKKVFIAIIAALSIVSFVAFLLISKKDSTKQLFQSDIMSTNIKYPVLSGKDSLRFFPGNNSASLNIQKPTSSTSTSPATPMGVITKVAWYSGGALVKINPMSDSSYLLSAVSDPLLYKNTASWWKVTSSGPALFSAPGIPSTNISDIYIDDGGVMHLVYENIDNGKYGIARFSSVDNGVQTLKTQAIYELPGIVGGDSTNTYFRDAIGAIYDNTGSPIIAKSYGAKYDPRNKHIVYSVTSNTSNDDTSEGGIAKDANFTIYSFSGGGTKPTVLGNTPLGEFFVSNGAVLIPITAKDAQNKLIVVQGSLTNEYSVRIGKQPLSGLSNLFFNGDNEFTAVDNDGNLSVISSDEAFVASLPSAKLIKTNKRDISIQNGAIYYDLTENTAEVVLYSTVSNNITTAISASKKSVEAELGDLNQVSISWILSSPPSGEAGLD